MTQYFSLFFSLAAIFSNIVTTRHVFYNNILFLLREANSYFLRPFPIKKDPLLQYSNGHMKYSYMSPSHANNRQFMISELYSENNSEWLQDAEITLQNRNSSNNYEFNNELPIRQSNNITEEFIPIKKETQDEIDVFLNELSHYLYCYDLLQKLENPNNSVLTKMKYLEEYKKAVDEKQYIHKLLVAGLFHDWDLEI